MFFENVYEKGLAVASYVVGCQVTGTAIVIDPKRDVDTYLNIAEREELVITHVAETHIHADFLSGSRELARATGARILLSDEGGADWRYEFDHVGIGDGDEFMVGNLRFEVLHTPGHTPEHVCFLLTDTPAGDIPVILFSGDCVFVGDVGRPDLLEKAAGIRGTSELGAKQMFASLQRFKGLPDHIQVWPAHGAGSACGKALGAVPASTVGYEKLTNWALQHEDEAAFISDLLSGQPEPPRYFAMMKKLNRVERPLIESIIEPPELDTEEVARAHRAGTVIVDTRNRTDYALGHIPGSLSIEDGDSLSTWAGWFLEYDQPFIVVAPRGALPGVVRRLMRVGLDQVAGYIPDVTAWRESGRTLDQVTELSPEQLHQLPDGSVQIIDVRQLAEHQDERLGGSFHIYAGHVLEHLDRLDVDKQVVLQCRTGHRSLIAYSALSRRGVKNVVNLVGGLEAWKAAGYAVEDGVDSA